MWTSLRATKTTGEQAYDDEDSLTGFERMVRSVTKNEQYKFGDVTKSVVETSTTTLTNGVEDVVRSVTHDEDYQFGDLSKKGLEGTV